MSLASYHDFEPAIGPLTTQRVLVIDDDNALAEATAGVLHELGYSVSVANSYDAAIKHLRDFPVDIAIVDLKLGRRDGIELIGVLRREYPKLPCILLTAYADTDTAIRALRNGASDYLFKPIEFNMLDAVINRCLEKSQLEHEKEVAERALRESEARFRAFFENTPVCMSVKDRDGRYAMVNEPHAEWLGETVENTVGRMTEDLISDPGRNEAVSAAEQSVIETGRPFQDKTRVTRENGLAHDRLIVKFPIRADNGDISGIGTVAIDVTDTSKLERKLAESEARFRAVIDNYPKPITFKNTEGRILLANKAFAEMTDEPVDTVIGSMMMDYIEAEMSEKIHQQDRQVVETGEPIVYERAWHGKKGIRTDQYVMKFPAYDANGELMGIGTISTDITELKKTEKALRDSESLLRAIIDNNPSPISLKNTEHELLVVNKAFEELYDVSATDLVGKRSSEFLQPDHADIVEQLERDAQKTGKPQSAERVLKLRNGSEIHSIVVKFPIKSADGTTLHIGTTMTDITERREMEAAMRDSERQLRLLIDSLPVMISYIDADEKYVLVNKTATEWRASDAEETIGKSVKEHQPERYPALEELVRKTLSGVPCTQETQFDYGDGITRDTIITNVPDFAPDGSVRGFFGMVQDMTEQKKAERALARREAQLRAVIDNYPAFVSLKDQDGKYLLLNESFATEWNTTVDGAIGRTAADLGSPERAEEITVHDRQVLETGQPSTYEMEWSDRAGNIHPRAVTKFPTYDADGKLMGVGTISTDITEQKNAEAASRRSEARLRAIIDNYPSLITLKDVDGRYLLVNQAFAESRQISIKEAIGRSSADLETSVQAAVVKAHDEDALRQGGPVTYERYWVDQKGMEFPRAITKFPAYDADGNLMGIGTISTDISARKHVEDALRESEAMLRSIIDSSPSPMSLKGLDHKLLIVNKAYEDMYGMTAGELLGQDAGFFMNREHADQVTALENRVIESGQVRSEERSAKLPNGLTIQSIVTKFPVKNAKGTVTLIGTIMTDISDRKQMEIALRESEAQLQLVVDSLPVLVTYIDTNEEYVFANKVGAEWYATTPNHFVGRSVADMQGPNYEIFREKIKESLSGKKITFESNATFPDGNTREIEVTNVPDIGPDGKVRGFFGMTQDISERKQAERRIKESEARFRAVVDNSPAAIYLKDIDGRYLIVNKTFREWLNVDSDEDWLGKTANDFFDSNKMSISEAHDLRIITERKPVIEERTLAFPDGVERKTLNHKFPIFGSDGECIAIGTVNMDITDQHELQSQLVQAQKMEAVGQLTGGVAHDFNNLLGVIIGNLDFLADELRDNEELTSLVEPAMKAALSGATLNKQLLAFSRKQALSPKVIDLNQHIASVLDMLHRVLGETIEVEAMLDPSISTTEVDPAQLESVLLNLAVNARDAMPDGGSLKIKTHDVHLSSDDASIRPEVFAGDYVVLAVTDTGTGMSSDVQTQAFDPFFTTKGVGEGSGLGLSMVFGFTKQSGGHVEIESEIGQGTTVKVYLPAVVRGIREDPREEPGTPKANGETIMVVEDDPGMLDLVTNYLNKLDYTVLAAASGQTALDVLEGAGPVDLLLTDVVMPKGISGPALAEMVRERRPKIKIVFMSGYTANKLNPALQQNGKTPLLLKPFRNADLAKTVRKALDT